MKRAVLVLIIFVLCVGIMSGCSSRKDVISIGISQIVEHPALDALRLGILEGLTKEGFRDGEKLKVDIKNAQGDINNAITIANGFVLDKKNMIITIATPTTQAAAQATKEIPIIFAAVTDPVAADLVTALDKIDGNITGTSDQLPMSLQIDLIKRFIPNITNLGVVYTTSEVNAGVQVDDIEQAAKASGIHVVRAGITNSSEVRVATESILKKVDAILIPIDNTVVSAFEGVLSVTQKEGVPVFASDTDTVKRGAVATYGIDYGQMGVQTGEMAARILKGEKLADNPIEVTKNAELTINLTAATIFGLQVSDELKKEAKELVE